MNQNQIDLRRLKFVIMVLGLLWTGLMVISPANATLDENESSVDRDMTHFKAAKRKRLPGQNSSRVHEIDSDSQTIRQYSDSSGHIYAITWDGVSQPDLSVLLGKHFPEYTVQTRTRALQRGGRGPRRFVTSGAVIQQTGHMRSLRGIAYIPSRVPSGINPGDLP